MIADIVRIIVTLPVTDENDERPEFRNKPYPYLTTMASTEAAGAEIYELYASDADENSQIEYEFLSGKLCNCYDQF